MSVIYFLPSFSFLGSLLRSLRSLPARVSIPAVRCQSICWVYLKMRHGGASLQLPLGSDSTPPLQSPDRNRQSLLRLHRRRTLKLERRDSLDGGTTFESSDSQKGRDGARPSTIRADGKTTSEIAAKLKISMKTVHAYCGRLKQKLDAANFNRLVRIAVLWRAGVAEIVVRGVRGE